MINKNQQGYFSPITVVIILAIIALIVYQLKFNSKTNSSNINPTPNPSASLNLKVNTKSSPKISSSPTSSPSPSSSISPTPTPQASNNSDARIEIETTCSISHDDLGPHLDVTAKFLNLDKLNSQDLIVNTIDTLANKQSTSHLSTSYLNNQTIPMHKYVFAFQGSTVPLELIPDGREYLLNLEKATYKSDGTIDVYVTALEQRFSKKCDF